MDATSAVLVTKVIAKHALIVGGIAAGATIARDLIILATAKKV